MSYSQISDIIDSLVLQLPQPESSVPHVPTPPTQSPQINFFADGDINEVKKIYIYLIIKFYINIILILISIILKNKKLGIF